MRKFNVITLILLLGVIFISSCDESISPDVNTTISKTITADIVAGKKSLDDFSIFPFYVIDTLNIENNADVQKNIDRIKELKINNVSCKITGIPLGESIPELNIVIPEAYINVSLTQLVENNSLIVLDVSKDLLNAVSSVLLNTHEFTIMVNGFSSYAPMQLGVELSFDTTLKTNL